MAKSSRPESSRRMHMRQHSAQILVEDIKGQEQSRACRDVIFLLLFVFHLVFVGYLGNIYGKEALKPHDEDLQEQWNATMDYVSDDDLILSTPEVTIYYKNLFYVGCLSGPFAVALSALLLSAMTFFARALSHLSFPASKRRFAVSCET